MKRSNVRGRTIPVNGLELSYEEFGSGEPLLLLHGFGGCGKNWQPFTEELSEHYRLIVVDLPGHGYSTNPANTFTHRAAAGDILQLLDALGIGRCSAMGISSGGMTLLHMAEQQPDRFNAMVLISATSHFPEQARAIMRASSFDRMPPPVQEMYRSCAPHGDAQVRRLIAQFNAFHESTDDMDFTEERLSAITVRTFVVHGDRDRFFPVDIPVSMYRALSDAALWIIPGGDHVPIYDPAVPFTATALRFLAGEFSAARTARGPAITGKGR